MTIIDSLVVSLGLDSKDMAAKSPAAVKNLKDIEQQGDKTKSGLESLGRTMGSFLALLGGTVAIKAFISDFIESNAQLDRFSRNLGLSVSTISAWSQATEQLGGSAAGLQGSLDMLSKSQTELMLTGNSALIPYLSMLGVAFAGVDGKARPVDDLLLDIAGAAEHVTAVSSRTNANNILRSMGLDQGTANLLLQGREAVELTIKRQKEQNAVTKAQAEEASKLQTRIVSVKQTFEAFGRQLLMEATPTIEKLLKLFQDFGDWCVQNKEVIADFLKIVAVGLAAIALASSPISLTVLAVLALAAGIALLWQDYQVWARGGNSEFDWSAWKKGIDIAGEALTALTDILKGFGEMFNAVWKSITGSNYVDDFTAGIQAIKDFIGIRDTSTSKGNSPLADNARRQAARVSAKTGMPAELIYGQWAHETGNFTNRGATQLNNFAGINVPGGKGQDYRSFSSLDEFGDYYAQLMSPEGRYANARNAKTPEELAAALKAGGYYADTESNYAAGIRRFESQYSIPSASSSSRGVLAQSLMGTPGLTSRYTDSLMSSLRTPGQQASNVDRSVETHIGEITINTQATDANGIAMEIGHSLDYLTLAGQANSGMN